MRVDPQLLKEIGPPTRPAQSKHRWRDIGGGLARDETTKRLVAITSLRSPPVERMIILTAEQWAKLEALARHKSTIKHTFTPIECVVCFINSCVTKATWAHPLKTAARHRGRSKDAKE